MRLNVFFSGSASLVQRSPFVYLNDQKHCSKWKRKFPTSRLTDPHRDLFSHSLTRTEIFPLFYIRYYFSMLKGRILQRMRIYHKNPLSALVLTGLTKISPLGVYHFISNYIISKRQGFLLLQSPGAVFLDILLYAFFYHMINLQLWQVASVLRNVAEDQWDRRTEPEPSTLPVDADVARLLRGTSGLPGPLGCPVRGTSHTDWRGGRRLKLYPA